MKAPYTVIAYRSVGDYFKLNLSAAWFNCAGKLFLTAVWLILIVDKPRTDALLEETNTRRAKSTATKSRKVPQPQLVDSSLVNHTDAIRKNIDVSVSTKNSPKLALHETLTTRPRSLSERADIRNENRTD